VAVTTRCELNFPNPIETRAELFDREPELDLVGTELRSPARRPVVVMGERVMGKTSLLNVVVEWLAQQGRFSVLQLPHVMSRDILMEEVLDGIAAETQTSLHRRGLRDSRGRLQLSTVTDFTRVAGQLCDAAAGRTFVLCLDELDSVLVNCRDDRSAEQILDLVLHVVARTTLPIKFLFTVTRTAPQILRSDASPFLSAARIVPLLPWQAEQARAFVAALLPAASTLDDDAHTLLFRLGGGHPYLTKAVLRSLLELDRPAGPVTVADIRAAMAAAVSSPEVDFTLENIAKVHFSAQEREVLQRLASVAGPVPAAELPAPASVLYTLAERRYLWTDSQARYGEAFGLLGEWLQRRPWAAGRPPAGPPPALADAAPATTAAHTAPTGPAGRGGRDLGGEPVPLVVDDDRKLVFLGPDELQLTAQEYRFLNCLATRAGRVVDRHTIATEVWAQEILIGGVREGRLDALVHRLREELGADAAGYIETRRGRGYYVSPERVRRVPGAPP
jgi:hypothetical protein